MQRALRTAFSVSLLGATASLGAAQIQTIATESFDYGPGFPVLLDSTGGGTGFSNNWYVTDPPNHDEIDVVDNSVAMPTFGLADAVGGYARVVTPGGESYRVVDAALHPDVVDAPSGVPVFGADGATIWISFSAVRYAGTTTTGEHYGGFSLFEQGCCEALYIGSPWDTGAWGIDDEGPTGPQPVTVAGSDNRTETRIVVRIDHLAGDERLRMWLNPAVPHPNTPADLDEMIDDLRWQEISFRSGGNGGELFYFDNLVIEKGIPANPGTNYCPANNNSTGVPANIFAVGSDVAANNDLTLHAEMLPTNAFAFFLTSQAQSFVMNPGGSQGNLCLGGSIGRYVGPGQVQNSGATGEVELTLDLTMTPQPTGFVSVVAGQTWNFQAWFRDVFGGSATSNFTNGLEILFN